MTFGKWADVQCDGWGHYGSTQLQCTCVQVVPGLIVRARCTTTAVLLRRHGVRGTWVRFRARAEHVSGVAAALSLNHCSLPTWVTAMRVRSTWTLVSPLNLMVRYLMQ